VSPICCRNRFFISSIRILYAGDVSLISSYMAIYFSDMAIDLLLYSGEFMIALSDMVFMFGKRSPIFKVMKCTMIVAQSFLEEETMCFRIESSSCVFHLLGSSSFIHWMFFDTWLSVMTIFLRSKYSWKVSLMSSILLFYLCQESLGIVQRLEE